MKNKTALVLMEQLVMILVFALAACVCLQIFATSDRISRDTEQMDRAVVLAQNGAEAMKACAGDVAAAEGMLEEKQTHEGLELVLEQMESEIDGLGRGQVRVLEQNTGECLILLTVAWQEVGE